MMLRRPLTRPLSVVVDRSAPRRSSNLQELLGEESLAMHSRGARREIDIMVGTVVGARICAPPVGRDSALRGLISDCDAVVS